MIGVFLVGGLVNAAVLVVVAFLLSRLVGDIYGRSLLVIFLFIAGGAYVEFAVGEGASPIRLRKPYNPHANPTSPVRRLR